MSGGGITIEPVDDVEFRQDVIQSFTHGDVSRNHEIHFTDLINCLFCSFLRKIMPEQITDEKYNDLLDWMRGLAFDTTITNRFAGKRDVWIGRAQGTIDMMYPSKKLGYVMPYELTSTPFLPRDIDRMVVEGERYRYKVEQLKLYMAALCMNHGRLKIIQMVNARKGSGNGKADVGKASKRGTPTTSPKGLTTHGPPQYRSKLQTREHTFDVRMTPLALAETRFEIICRQGVLSDVLDTGGWLGIPKRYRPILADSPCADSKGRCSSYQDALKNSNRTIVDRAWRSWAGRGE